LAVVRCDALPVHEARIVEVQPLSARIIRVALSMPEGFSFCGGQFVQLVRPRDGLMRPYSIASLPGERWLELHVALHSEGRMSQWLAQARGEHVQVRGPLGECCYPAGDHDRPLLLAGTGTGLAPLYAVLRTALQSAHTGARIAASVPGSDSIEHGITSRPLLDQVLASDLPLAQSRAFLCGNPQFVRHLRKQLYLLGMPLERIHADPFVPPAAAT
jgi:ferredoxin-NADP reductase